MELKLYTSTWNKDELKAINRVIESDKYTMGQEVLQFENEFADKMGIPYAIMSNSGSSANLLAIASLFYSDQLQKDDEVILPAVSWSTTYYPLYQFGLKLRFVDVDLKTLNIDTCQIEKAITKNTKAIFVVDILGNPCNYSDIFYLCNKHKLLLIEDACQAMGAKYNDQYTGTFGKIGTYSINYSNHISSIEGGITVTNDENLYNIMLALRNYGSTRDLPQKSKIYKKKKDLFYEDLNFILPGYNLKPNDLQAAIAREQLKKLDNIVMQRRINADYFKYMAKNLHVIIQIDTDNSSYFGFSVIVESEKLRDLIIEELNKEHIETKPILAGNFTRNPVIKYFNYSIFGTLTNADIIHDRGFYIGNQGTDISKNILSAFAILMPLC